MARQVGNDDVQVGRGGELRRLADGLKQELANIAVVRIVIAAGGYDLAGGSMLVVALVFTFARFVCVVAAARIVSVMACVARERAQAVMMRVARREPVQAFAHERDAGIRGQNRADQDLA
jgi:hypothetical protein